MVKNIAIIGSGYWGKNLVRNFSELGVLKTICDLNKNVLNDFKKQYPEVHITTSFQEVLEDRSIKAIVVSTPAVLHYKMVKEALSYGKDVFVEKPLSLNVHEGKELVKIAESKGNILMVGHILQYHPAVLKLYEMIKKGELGKIQYIYSNRLNLGKFRTEENILWSFAPHDISVILMFLNEMPKSLTSHAGTYLSKDVADVTFTTMEFHSGVKAHIFVSWLHPYKEQKLVVVGSKKMAVFNDVSDKKLFLYPHEIEWINRVPVPRMKDAMAVKTEIGEPLKEECKHFIECIKSRNDPKTSGREGLQVLEILEASQKSLENNGETVLIHENSYFSHSTSIVDQPCSIGKGTKIWHFSHIMTGAKIGDNCNIGQNVMIAPDVVIGNNVKIQNNVSVYTGVKINNDAFLGPSMVFTNVKNPRSFISRKNEFKETLIGEGASIGANVTIVCGNTIGNYAFVGAGAVVTKNIPDYALAVGNPARITGWICECGLKLNFSNNQAVCSCGSRYEKIDDNVKKTKLLSAEVVKENKKEKTM
jgi:UDP-2-acetamido-3-amino-2,3-dideoxy-glucuronate N-acetyltransferase